VIKNPEIGLCCFLIVDVWEEFAPAPVTITGATPGGTFSTRWELDEGYFEDYNGITPQDLFLTAQEAAEEIKERRRKTEYAAERSTMPSGSVGERGTTMPF
jgi:hypothetical protein